MDALTTRATLEFTAEQRKLIRDSFANGASETEFGVLMEVAKARRLNPLLKQIHFVKRYDSTKACEVWSTQVGIDGFRAIAERTGKYDGQDEPEWVYDQKGALKACKVRVFRKDISRAFVGVAFFSEYAQFKRDGTLVAMWLRGPHFMLAKCAEALAHRKAFPEDTAGLYIPEELGDGPEEREINPSPQPSTDKAPAPSRTQETKELVRAQLAAGPAVAPSLPKAPAKASRMAIVDVQPGETEEQAQVRHVTKQEAPKPLPQGGVLWDRVQALLHPTGMDAFAQADFLRQTTGAKDRKELREEHLDVIRQALLARHQQTAPAGSVPMMDATSY